MTNNLPATRLQGTLVWSTEHELLDIIAPDVLKPIIRLMVICEQLRIKEEADKMFLDMLKNYEKV